MNAKKKITFLSALFFAGSLAWANPQSLNVVFDGQDHAGWTTANNSTSTVDDGHLICNMAINGAKYRGDIQFNGVNNASVSFDLNPTKDCYLAVKFIGERPDGKLKMEFNDGSQWYNTKWNGGSPSSILTSGGNTIYYFRLGDDEKFTGENVKVQRLNLVIADAVNAPFDYTVDWVATFSSIEELEAYKDFKDDGDADRDETNVVLPAVQNKRSGDGYTALSEAVSSALSGDTLLIHNDLMLTSRIDITTKQITLIAPTVDVALQRVGNAILLLSKGSEAGLTIGGTGARIILDGMSQVTASPFIEINDGATVTLRGNVSMRNCYSTNLYGTAICNKNSGKLILEDVVFENCKMLDSEGNTVAGYGTVFVGSYGTTLHGDNQFTNCSNDIFIEADYTLSAQGVTHTEPINIMIADPVTRTKQEVVLDCQEQDKFNLINEDYCFVSNGEHLEFVKQVDNAVDTIKDTSLIIYGGDRQITIVSDEGLLVRIFTVDGVCVLSFWMEAGERVIPELSKGLYLVNQRKVFVK